MEKAEFAYLIDKICHFWERKPPKEEDFLEWFEMVCWIPDGYRERIYKRFTRMTSRPVNIPLVIQDVFRGFTNNRSEKSSNIVIERVMGHCDDHPEFNFLESFYDLRYAIKRKRLDIGPAIRWLRAEGFEVDMDKFNEPSDINFDHLREWLHNVAKGPDCTEKRREGQIEGDQQYDDEVPF